MGALTMQWGELEKNSEIKKQWGSGAGGAYLVLKSNTCSI